MTKDKLNEIIKRMFDDIMHINNTKGADYAPGKDALENFKKNAEKWGLTKYQTWGVYAGKHMDAIGSAVKNNPNSPERKGEPLRESIKDVVLYMCLLDALMEEDVSSTQVEQKQSVSDILGATEYKKPSTPAAKLQEETTKIIKDRTLTYIHDRIQREGVESILEPVKEKSPVAQVALEPTAVELEKRTREFVLKKLKITEEFAKKEDYFSKLLEREDLGFRRWEGNQYVTHISAVDKYEDIYRYVCKTGEVLFFTIYNTKAPIWENSYTPYFVYSTDVGWNPHLPEHRFNELKIFVEEVFNQPYEQ